MPATARPNLSPPGMGGDVVALLRAQGPRGTTLRSPTPPGPSCLSEIMITGGSHDATQRGVGSHCQGAEMKGAAGAQGVIPAVTQGWGMAPVTSPGCCKTLPGAQRGTRPLGVPGEVPGAATEPHPSCLSHAGGVTVTITIRGGLCPPTP